MPNEDQQPEAPITEAVHVPDPAELQVEAASDPAEALVAGPLGEPEVVEPGDTVSDPVTTEVPLDPSKPLKWIEQDGPPRERKLPAAGQIHIQWQMLITGSQGVIYEGDYDFVHKQIDSPAHVHCVGKSVEKILQGTLIDPLVDDLSLYTTTRVSQMAVKAPAPAPSVPLLADSPSTSPIAVPPMAMTALPPPPNPGAKI